MSNTKKSAKKTVMEKVTELLERITPPQKILERKISSALADISIMRKKSGSPGNRLALDNVIGILEDVRSRAREYSRDEVTNMVCNVDSILCKISETVAYDKSMNTYIALLIEYLSCYVSDRYARRKAKDNLEGLMASAEIVYKNAILEENKNVEISKRTEKAEDVARLTAEKEQKLSEMDTAANEASFNILRYDVNDLNRRIKTAQTQIDSINSRIVAIDEDIRNNTLYATHLEEIDFLVDLATKRAFSSVEDYQKVVERAKAEWDSHEEVVKDVIDIEKAYNGGRTYAQEEEDPEIQKHEMKFRQNQRDKEIAKEDNETFGLDSAVDRVKTAN